LQTAVNWSVGTVGVLSLLFATGSGLYLLVVVGHFIMNFGVALSGLVEAVIIGWILNRTVSMREYNNKLSDFRIGGWWNFFLIVVTPSVLGYMAIKNITAELTENYGGYTDGLISVGWAVSVLALVIGFYFQSLKSTNPEFSVKEDETA